MLKLNTDQKRIPLGGHQFYEFGVTFKGETFEEVAKKVEAFRVNNGIPLGDPRQDILTRYLETCPWMVKADDKSLQIALEQDYVAWREWMLKVWKSPFHKMRDIKDAQIRQEICAGCKFNRLKDWGTSDESKELEKRSLILRRGHPVMAGLGFCTCHKWDNSVSPFIDQVKEYSNKDADQQSPANCWV